MRKLKFVIYTFLALLLLIATTAFIAVPIAKTVVSKVTGIYFNFNNIDYVFPDTVVIDALKIQKPAKDSELNVSVGKLTVSVGKLHGNWAVSSLLIDNVHVDFKVDKPKNIKKKDSEKDEEKKVSSPKVFELPFFPLGKISVKSVSLNIQTPTASILSSNIELEGDKKYVLKVPGVILTPQDSSVKPFKVSLDASFMADGKKYAILGLDVDSPFLNINGENNDETGLFNAEYNVLTEEIFSVLGVKSKGSVSGNVSIKSEITGIPDADVILKSRIKKINEFSPWDFDLDAKIYTKGFDINELAFLRGKKRFLTAKGSGVFADNAVSGTIKMDDVDFRDIMRRVDVSTIVDMFVDGDVKFSNPLDGFKLALDADLKVRKFHVKDDDFTIVKLAEPYYVKGNLVIDSSRVSLFKANVFTKDKLTNLFLKDTWFGLGDEFYINIIKGSQLDVGKIENLLGLHATGKGKITTLISSRYENPLIKGDFYLSNVVAEGFNLNSVKGSLLLKDFVMNINSDHIAFGSSKTADLNAVIDLSGENTIFDLTVNNLSGDISDFGKLSGSSVPVNGLYTLSAKLKLIDSNIETANVYFESSDIRDGKHVYANKAKLHLGTFQNGFFIDNAFVSKKRTRIDIAGKIGRDFNADINGKMTSFFIEDFAEFGDFSAISFMAPQLNISVTGNIKDDILVKSDFFLGKLAYDNIVLGNLSANMRYKSTSNSLNVKGNLGEGISFSLGSSNLSTKNMETSVKIDNYHLETETGALDITSDIKYGTAGVDILVSKLKLSEPVTGLYVENTSPISAIGEINNIAINKATFGGNVADFSIEGIVKEYVPDIKLKGSLYMPGLETKYSKSVSDLKGSIAINAYLKGDLYGADALIDNFSFYIKPLSISLSDINGKFILTNKGWKTENLEGVLGDGVIKLNGSGIVTPAFSGIFNLSLNNAIIKPKQVGQMRVSSNLELNIPEDDLISVAGDIELKNITYRKTISLESTLIKSLLKPKKFYAKTSTGKESPVRLNVNLKAKNDINLETNLVKTSLDIDLNVSGDTENPIVKGYVTLKDGTIYFQNNEFEIDRGMIDIDTYEEIRPYLDIESSTEVSVRPRGSLPDDDQRVNYQLYLKIFGYLDDIQIDLSSNPYEEQTDVYSILLFGELFDDEGFGQMNMGSIAISAVSGIVGINEAVQNNFKLTSFELKPMTDRDGKTVLKFSAMKEIYPFLRVTLISNPVDTKDQKLELKYKGDIFNINLDYSSYSDYETNYGSIGFDVRLDYGFE